MMLKKIDSFVLQKNVFSRLDNDSVNNNNINITSESVFDKMTKHLLSKEIEFNNISTKEKKKHNNNLSKNFLLNHLIDILYRQNIILKKNKYDLNHKDSIQKKNWIMMSIFLNLMRI